MPCPGGRGEVLLADDAVFEVVFAAPGEVIFAKGHVSSLPG